MGQYYTPTIISVDGEFKALYSHDFGDGLKLMEHSWVGNEFVNAVYSRIFKQRAVIAWIGDYANDKKKEYETGEEPFTRALPYKDYIRYYKLAWSDRKEHFLSPENFSMQDLKIFTLDTEGMYLINHTEKRYVDLTKYIRDCRVKDRDGEYWCVNPLPLLTACGNGRGGGDYFEKHPCYKDVGTWAFHTLEYTDTIPAGYAEAVFAFSEDWVAA